MNLFSFLLKIVKKINYKTNYSRHFLAFNSFSFCHFEKFLVVKSTYQNHENVSLWLMCNYNSIYVFIQLLRSVFTQLPQGESYY